jgi:uncharacterized protein (DUF1778 family)
MAKASKRNIYVTVRVTEEQSDALDRAAQERRCDRSEYIRSKLFDDRPPANDPPDPANDKE